MKKVVSMLLLMCAFFSSCSERCYHCDLGYALIFEHSKKMQQIYESKLSTIGGSFFGNHVNELFVTLSHHQAVDVDQARSMMIKGIDEFLSSINSDQKIRVFLRHYPFSYQDIEYSMDFLSPDGHFLTNGSIAYVSLVKGTVYYDVYDENAQKLVDYFEEPYLEALEKVLKK